MIPVGTIGSRTKQSTSRSQNWTPSPRCSVSPFMNLSNGPFVTWRELTVMKLLHLTKLMTALTVLSLATTSMPLTTNSTKSPPGLKESWPPKWEWTGRHMKRAYGGLGTNESNQVLLQKRKPGPTYSTRLEGDS